MNRVCHIIINLEIDQGFDVVPVRVTTWYSGAMLFQPITQIPR